jgi:thiol-disulfide isomerase/thioredoxin/sugar lactone lactonase YvrE
MRPTNHVQDVHTPRSNATFPIFISLALAFLSLCAASLPADEPQSATPTASRRTPEVVVAQADEEPAPKKKPAAKTEAAQPTDADKANAKVPPDDADAPQGPQNPFPKRFPAPDFDGGAEWLNVAGEITLRDVRGKIVLLDFWTYCCINCMHVLPDLAYLEKKYPNEIVVIGVHSAKFDNEKDSANIRDAILRYEIEHPVINDNEMTVWRKFNVRAWPTLVLLDPEGQYCGYVSGEGNRELLETVIDKLVAYHRAKGTLDETPVSFHLEKEKAAPTPLRFPGKLLADETGNRLFISDSNHNRIVITNLAGKQLDVIGTGAVGRKDGGYAEATFDHPQGIALKDEVLYVADTENHLIRAIDLRAKTVSTIAGTGSQGHPRGMEGPALQTEIGSPWDLVFAGDLLYIAMAGPHQIWSLDLAKKTIAPFSGSSREDIVNGPHAEAALAQPSGICTDGKFLYVVDSEGSAVRKIDLDPQGRVETIVGTSDLPRGRSLFEFGDIDGEGSDARLQHPLGIVHHNGQLFVADSYNHKVKRVDPVKNTATSYLGSGKPGRTDDPPTLSEPAGLSIAGKTLYIADTNNHLIRTVDLESGKLTTLALDGVAPPTLPKPEAVTPTAKDAIPVPAQTVAVGDSLAFDIALQLPEGYKLNPLSPVFYTLTAEGEQPLVAADHLGSRAEIDPPKAADAKEKNTVTIRVPAKNAAGQATFQLKVIYGYCREGKGGLCKLATAHWKIPVTTAPDAKGTTIPLEAPPAP